MRGGAGERNSLVLAGELVSGMNFLVTSPAKRRLVGAAEYVRLRHFANVALYLHLPHPPTLFSLSKNLQFISQNFPLEILLFRSRNLSLTS